jgi:ElaB/YqjD/DUF883 family membrane-anchored ribosome-binding protein
MTLSTSRYRKGITMQTQNGTNAPHQMLRDQLSSIRHEMSKLVERLDAATANETPRLRAFADRAGRAIKAHPIAAVATAFGVGYVVMRLVRR